MANDRAVVWQGRQLPEDCGRAVRAGVVLACQYNYNLAMRMLTYRPSQGGPSKRKRRRAEARRRQRPPPLLRQRALSVQAGRVAVSSPKRPPVRVWPEARAVHSVCSSAAEKRDPEQERADHDCSAVTVLPARQGRAVLWALQSCGHTRVGWVILLPSRGAGARTTTAGPSASSRGARGRPPAVASGRSPRRTAF
jgi:hypothetical protein